MFWEQLRRDRGAKNSGHPTPPKRHHFKHLSPHTETPPPDPLRSVQARQIHPLLRWWFGGGRREKSRLRRHSVGSTFAICTRTLDLGLQSIWASCEQTKTSIGFQ
ncbi:hypothetical protein PanWU01x14_164710 [Parasponia andersonii]|uniref:Uncharacterized protein n=1 Tax=Parasponia andersonii TaxID=3476 RepID=A0A2P5CCK5_PARAD|nr:hypothetical protein PanWU01x14_164710 [Parasponia andersonii]